MQATKLKILGVVLLFAVFDSQAMTLGRMRGAALVGHGLDLAIQVQADPEETLSSQCFEADVFHGDTRQEPSRVQLVVESTQTAQTFNVRIASSTLVDEPVVIAERRAGSNEAVRVVIRAGWVEHPKSGIKQRDQTSSTT